jgi:hypothetical protein
MTDEQLMRLLDHPDPKVRDAARRQLDARRQTGSTTADLANETRPVPEVKAEDNGWKNGAFNWDLVKQEMAAQRERDAAAEEARRAEWDTNYGDGTYDYRGAAGAVRRDRGLRQPASKQEQLDAMRAAQIADLEQQRQDEAGVLAHNARVAGLVGGSTPADLDPVESAATPVVPDSPVRSQAASPRATPSPAPFFGRTVAGPAPIDGGVAEAPEAFASQEEADEYNTRRRLSADEAAPVTVNPMDAPQVGPDGMAGSQRDIDMRKRGFVPVYGQDGSVTYKLEAPSAGDTNAIGGAGRWGMRPDLELSTGQAPDGTPRPGRYVGVPTDGPLGRQMVYRPTDEYKQELRDIQRYRDANRKAEFDERHKQVVLQAQAKQRPMNFLNNPNANEWAQRVMSEALLRSGRPGATPLDVEGQQMANMQDIFKQFATAGFANMQNQAQAEAAERMRKEELLRQGRRIAGREGRGYMPGTRRSVNDAREAARIELQDEGYDAATIRAILDEMYPLPAPAPVNPRAMQ